MFKRLWVILFAVVFSLSVASCQREPSFLRGGIVEPGEDNTLEDSEATGITVTVGKYTFVATLFQTKVTGELMALLPLTETFEDLNGNEKYWYLSVPLTKSPRAIGEIKEGDIMLYGDDCLVIFYKDFSTLYEYTKIGHIENIRELQRALGGESVKITIKK